jgi:hypothetical protein
MCVDVIYKFACGCRVSPKGAPYREMCVTAAQTNRVCWAATDGQRDELWHGTEVCPVHKGKNAQPKAQNGGAGGNTAQGMPANGN